MLEKIARCTKDKKTSKLENRILAELKFAYVVSREYDNAYDTLVREVEDYVINQIDTVGSVTADVLAKAEEMLAPVGKLAKEYNVLCVAHGHIDMNWMWGFEETVAATVDTFRTMLDLMNEYPDYKYSQSQASVYKIIEEYYPDMLEEIKQRVKEGRWEITASTWVETDKNMPNGESLSRHILYTKEYLSKLFDLSKDDLQIDFEPDTFGHNKNVPEILANGGVKFYYHCRGYEFNKPLYRWNSESGNAILVYREPYWYNAEINTDIVNSFPDLAKTTGSKTLLKVYGVGNHGGGPTRRDVNRLIEYNTYPIFPTFKFSTFIEYFKSVEHLIDEVPQIDTEINFLCDGCYTTQSVIKAGNRKSESLLYNSEALAAFASKNTSYRYPTKLFADAWKKVLFNHFHDIIPGSGIQATREYASGLYQEVFATAQTTEKQAVKTIIDQIDTSSLFTCVEDTSESTGQGAGVAYMPGQFGRGVGRTRVFNIFNSCSFDKNGLAKVNIWDYEGDITSIAVYDSKGNKVPHQKVSNNFQFWGHQCDTIVVDVAVPSYGYITIVIREEQQFEYLYNHCNNMRVQHAETFVLENDLIKVEFNPIDSSIKSYTDKKTNTQVAVNSGIFRIADEAAHKQSTYWGMGMSAWFIGRYKNIENIGSYEFVPVEKGELYNSFSYWTTFRNSKIKVTVSLDKNSTDLNYAVSCDWREFGSNEVGIPNLNFYLPLNYDCNTYKYDVPFGVIDRVENNIDNPGNTFALAKNETGTSSLMIMAKTKYGYRCYDNSMALTLIRGSYDPDKTPETMTHEIEFAVSLVDNKDSNKALIERSRAYNQPLTVWSSKNHKGTLPLQHSCCSFDSDSVVISSVKSSEKDSSKLVIRVYETQGKQASVKLNLDLKNNITSGYFTDINEDKVLDAITVLDGVATFEVKPYSMATIILY